MHDLTPRLPRVLLAVLTIVSVTLFLSYTRISSTTYSLLWPEPEPFRFPNATELRSLFDAIDPMSYGTAARPAMKAMPAALVADLPPRHVPGRAGGPARRLVIVGDVHGQRAALDALLDKVGFGGDAAGDHLVLAGDLTNKGPDSAGVLALAMELGAHAVRGNHDDRVLLARAALDRDVEDRARAQQAGAVDLETKVYEKGQQEEGKEGGGERGDHDEDDPKAAREEYLAREAALLLERDDRKEVATARTLSPEQVEWLAGLPVILNVGRIPRAPSPPGPGPKPSQDDITTTKEATESTEDPSPEAPAPAAFENLVVVHAGLVPGVALPDQDPWAAMTMRTLVYPVDDERRSAVRKYLEGQASRRHRGKVAAAQSIGDKMVDEYLGRVLEAQGLRDTTREGGGGGAGYREGDVALPTDGRDGVAWWAEWNRYQERLAGGGEEGGPRDDGRGLKGTTVVYGHDAKGGLTVPDSYGNGRGYTYGLDSGCVYGGKLSALVIEARPEGIVHGIVQVGCDKAVEPEDK